MATHQIKQAVRRSVVSHDHSHHYRAAGRRALLIVLRLIAC